jgi:hypothetical protein
LGCSGIERRRRMCHNTKKFINLEEEGLLR